MYNGVIIDKNWLFVDNKLYWVMIMEGLRKLYTLVLEVDENGSYQYIQPVPIGVARKLQQHMELNAS